MPYGSLGYVRYLSLVISISAHEILNPIDSIDPIDPKPQVILVPPLGKMITDCLDMSG